MLQQLRTRLVERGNAAPEGGEEGFTLIELMVVVLIIAILIAIAIPTFLGARGKAQDRAAQSNLRNALTAAKTAYVDSQNYASDGASVYSSIEPSLHFVAGSTNTVGEIGVAATADTVTLGAKSAGGGCFFIKDITTTTGGSPGTYFAKTSAGPCDPGATNPFTTTPTDPANHW